MTGFNHTYEEETASLAVLDLVRGATTVGLPGGIVMPEHAKNVLRMDIGEILTLEDMTGDEFGLPDD